MHVNYVRSRFVGLCHTRGDNIAPLYRSVTCIGSDHFTALSTSAPAVA